MLNKLAADNRDQGGKNTTQIPFVHSAASQELRVF